ncbi:MAG: hypothetical protein GIW99_04550 [Candidatus Eremiobacteraeota bacterium]|nr:hypothetical protein [Candidatus Eremiobacteraeota bacterium]MBC5826936.1 hypothetical protein [Candidatus Eremiobacteraeota bacterium]
MRLPSWLAAFGLGFAFFGMSPSPGAAWTEAGAAPKATAEGGSHQLNALQGCMNQWLFNGVWRVKVLKVESITKEFVNYPGYGVTIQVRNGSKKTTSMPYTGVADGGTLVLDDGNTLELDTEPMIAWHPYFYKDLPPSAGFTFTLDYYLPNKPDSVPKPQKWLLEVDPKKEGTTAPRYTTAEPSVRVDLRCDKGA